MSITNQHGEQNALGATIQARAGGPCAMLEDILKPLASGVFATDFATAAAGSLQRRLHRQWRTRGS